MTPKEIETWIDEWVLLYPDIEWNGRKLRSPTKYCINKMLKMCKSNPSFTKEVIFAATNQYLAEQEAKNWEYTKQSTYFINKLGQPSVLEEYCNKILEEQQRQPVINDGFILPRLDLNPINDFI